MRVDLIGAGLVAAAAALLVLPLNAGQAQGWPLWTWLCLGAAVAGFAGFAVQQRQRVGHGCVRLVTPTLFGKSAYSAGLAGIALFFSGLIGSQLLLTLFLQIGAVIQLGGSTWLWFELGHAEAFSIWHIVPGIVISGIGAGMVIAALFSVILAAVDDEVGSASGVLSAVQSIASSAGVAAFGSVFFAALMSGTAADGFRHALYIQGGLLLVFLVVTVVFPKQARPDETDASTDEPWSAVAV